VDACVLTTEEVVTLFAAKKVLLGKEKRYIKDVTASFIGVAL